MNPSFNRLAAVVVHYGKQEYTANLLKQLERFSFLDSVVVVLHSPYDHPHSSNFIFLEAENRGYSAGLNLGFQYLMRNRPHVSRVLAMNPDITVEEQQILELARRHEEERADCTFPTIHQDGQLVQGYRLTTFGTIIQVTTAPRYFPGTCFLINVEAWRKTGGFNEAYFHYYEDADLCLRLENSGSRIVHVPNVVISHVSKSGADYPASQLPRYAVRNHLLFLSHLGRMNFLSFLNVSIRHFLYLFRWKHGWRGIGEWYRGIREYRQL
jgi:GT2 family glycosyltransferase